MLEYNISEAELPTMIVRYEKKLILRSVITGQHLQDLGFAPVWEDVPITPALQARRQRIEAEYDAALEALVRLYPGEEPVLPPQRMPQLTQQQQAMSQSVLHSQSPQRKPLTLVTQSAPSPLAINETELPPCKVHRNYCCNYCSFCTQNPRSHLLHQRQVHGIRLSIHCCHHCQYASRYFQKLKRHVKMVHMGSSPGRSKMRNKIAGRRATKPKITQPTNSSQAASTVVEQTSNQAELPHKLPTKPTQPNQVLNPAQQPTENPQQPYLPTQNGAAGPILEPTTTPTLQTTMPPAMFKNPEAFFEAAYRNQLIQQQLQQKRFKEFVEFTNQYTKAPLPVLAPIKPTQLPMPTLNQQQRVDAMEDIKKMKPSIPATTTAAVSTNVPKLPSMPILSPNEQNTSSPDLEKKCVYGCRKCSYVTHIKSRYNKHVKYHSMPMIQCDKCEFRTTYKWNLTRHLRSHHGNGLYKCSVCSFSAHMKQSLTSHELNHHSPPLGHVTRLHNKPYRRRRCRVGGSDLVHDTKAAITSAAIAQQQIQSQNQANAAVIPKSDTLTAVDQKQNLNNLSSTVAHEGLKLLIKREAGTSSYISSQTSMLNTTEVVTNYLAVKPATEMATNSITSMGLDTFANHKDSSSASDCFTSSYSASPSSTCSNVSVDDHEAPLNLELPCFPEIAKPEAVKTTELQQELGTAHFPNSDLLVYQANQALNPQPPLSFQIPVPNIKAAEPPVFSYTPSQIFPPAQPAIYYSSVDSDPDSEDSDDSDDSFSTVSANETVPHGLHIAYDSSSSELKSDSDSSDLETSSACSSKLETNHELSHPREGLQENMTSLH